MPLDTVEMGVSNVFNYILFDNPVSKTAKSLFVGNKNGIPPVPAVTVITESKPLWKLAGEQGPFIRLAGIMGATAVGLGAYGAHRSYPKDRVDELKPIFETGNRYHFFHSVALLGVPLTRNPLVTGSLMILGTTLFSGACYYHAFTGKDKFGRFAPVGGTILIIAWLSIVF